jgi:hypothetical protein
MKLGYGYGANPRMWARTGLKRSKQRKLEGYRPIYGYIYEPMQGREYKKQRDGRRYTASAASLD